MTMAEYLNEDTPFIRSRTPQEEKELEERQKYADLLVQRLGTVVSQEMPKGMGKLGVRDDLWEGLRKIDREAIGWVNQYEAGLCSRTKVDSAAMDLLHAFRKQIATFKSEVPDAAE